jgi:hypothetical protein
MARVPNPLPIPTNCPHCGALVFCVGNQTIYGRPFGDWPYAYQCARPSCGAYVGLHPFTNYPLGTLADEQTRRARSLAKDYFNPLWKNRVMTRTEAYAWLATVMNLPPELCHFGLFNVDQCSAAVKHIMERTK